MAAPISPISAPAIPELVQNPGRASRTGEFQQLLAGAIERVETSRSAAGEGVRQFISGESDELHGTVLAVQRAELSFELFLQVRNKVVQAYQEIMRMQM